MVPEVTEMDRELSAGFLHVSELFTRTSGTRIGSRRPTHGERAEGGRCSTQEENDVRMERGCQEIGNGEANISLR